MAWPMRVRMVLVSVVAVALGVAVLAAIQNSGGDGDDGPSLKAAPLTPTPAGTPIAAATSAGTPGAPSAVASPSPAATAPPSATPTRAATPSATATAAATAIPLPTATPSPAPSPTRAARAAAACPLDQHICDVALRYQRMLVAQDIEGLVSSPRGYRITCPSPAGPVGPYPLCNGLPGGSALGYPLTTFDNPSGADDRDGVRKRLREWLAEAPGAADSWGPTDIRIASVGCGAATPTAPANCAREIDLVFTHVAASGRTALLFRLTPADNFANDGISALVSGKAPDVLFTGGTLAVGNGGVLFATAVVLSPWAPPDVGLP